MVAELLQGGYDLHVHTGPDVMGRKLDDFEMAERIQGLGMKGYGIKSHFFCTAERARLVQKIYPAVNPVGAISLNEAVGGINPKAVEMAARDGARIVWLPTMDAANELAYLAGGSKYEDMPPWAKVQMELSEQGKAALGISLLADGKLRREVHEVLDIVLENRMILATGHAGKAEIYALAQEAKARKFNKLVVTHPTFPSINLSKEEQRELAEMGVYMECCYGTIEPGLGIDWEEFYAMLRHVGPRHCILSSDLGQSHKIYPTDGMIDFVTRLSENGFSREEIKTMVVENTGFLVEH